MPYDLMSRPARIFTAILLFLVSLVIFAFLAREVVLEQQDLFDSRIFHLLSDNATPARIQAARFVSFFGSHLFLIPAHLIIIIALLFQKRITDAIITAFIPLSSFVLMLILKNYFHRDRPSTTYVEFINNFSFPSGHTFSSFVFAAVIIFLVWTPARKPIIKYSVSLLALLFSFIIGISRVVLRVHYASDVLAGFCIGLAWVIFTIWLHRRVVKFVYRRRKLRIDNLGNASLNGDGDERL